MNKKRQKFISLVIALVFTMSLQGVILTSSASANGFNGKGNTAKSNHSTKPQLVEDEVEEDLTGEVIEEIKVKEQKQVGGKEQEAVGETEPPKEEVKEELKEELKEEVESIEKIQLPVESISGEEPKGNVQADKGISKIAKQVKKRGKASQNEPIITWVNPSVNNSIEYLKDYSISAQISEANSQLDFVQLIFNGVVIYEEILTGSQGSNQYSHSNSEKNNASDKKLQNQNQNKGGNGANNQIITLQADVKLIYGLNTVTVKAVDKNKKVTQESRSVIYDNKGPNIELLSATKVTESTYLARVKVVDEYSDIDTVSIKGSSAKSSSEASVYEITLKLSEGNNSLEVQASDVGSNTSIETFNVEYEVIDNSEDNGDDDISDGDDGVEDDDKSDVTSSDRVENPKTLDSNFSNKFYMMLMVISLSMLFIINKKWYKNEKIS